MSKPNRQTKKICGVTIQNKCGVKPKVMMFTQKELKTFNKNYKRLMKRQPPMRYAIQPREEYYGIE